MTLIIIFIITLFLGVVYALKKTSLFKDKIADELYEKRKLARINYDLNPTKENKNELKKINREIDLHLYTDG